MSDSRIGAFAVLGLILFLLVEIAAVTALADTSRWRVLLAVPAIGRATPALLAWCFPAARPGGQGAAFSAGLRAWAVPLALGTAVVITTVALGPAGLLALAVGGLAALGLGQFWRGRLGGITGDVLGAGVEVAELGALLAMAAWTHAAR
jgi:adenosylcobinamide-GDP ribazoletransferase